MRHKGKRNRHKESAHATATTTDGESSCCGVSSMKSARNRERRQNQKDAHNKQRKIVRARKRDGNSFYLQRRSDLEKEKGKNNNNRAQLLRLPSSCQKKEKKKTEAAHSDSSGFYFARGIKEEEKILNDSLLSRTGALPARKEKEKKGETKKEESQGRLCTLRKKQWLVAPGIDAPKKKTSRAQPHAYSTRFLSQTTHHSAVTRLCGCGRKNENEGEYNGAVTNTHTKNFFQ